MRKSFLLPTSACHPNAHRWQKGWIKTPVVFPTLKIYYFTRGLVNPISLSPSWEGGWLRKCCCYRICSLSFSLISILFQLLHDISKENILWIFNYYFLKNKNVFRIIWVSMHKLLASAHKILCKKLILEDDLYYKRLQKWMKFIDTSQNQ